MSAYEEYGKQASKNRPVLLAVLFQGGCEVSAADGNAAFYPRNWFSKVMGIFFPLGGASILQSRSCTRFLCVLKVFFCFFFQSKQKSVRQHLKAFEICGVGRSRDVSWDAYFYFFCCSFYIDPCLLCIKLDDETITSISMLPNEADTSILLFYNQFMLKLLLAPKKSQQQKTRKCRSNGNRRGNEGNWFKVCTQELKQNIAGPLVKPPLCCVSAIVFPWCGIEKKNR